jgi:valyl-tRNA synthetase
MLHPFIPFVTEEIYQQMPYLRTSPTLCELQWEQLETPAADTKEMTEVIDLVSAVRSVKAALQIPHQRTKLAYTQNLSAEARLLVEDLARIDWCNASDIAPDRALPKPLRLGVATLDVEGKDNYRKKLEKDLESNRHVVKTTGAKLSGDFAANAKPEIVEKEREKLAAAERAVAELERELRGL